MTVRSTPREAISSSFFWYAPAMHAFEIIRTRMDLS